MGLKEDLEKEVAAIFRTMWTEREGTVVPAEDSLKLSNDAVKLDATVLYADLADSTKLVDNKTSTFSAEIYKTFLLCAAKIIKAENGVITAYDGDRIMAVFIEGNKNTSAVRAGMKIKWAVEEIVNPAKKAVYTSNEYSVTHVVGIDTSKLFVARTGVRGANDLVWVGRAANYAAKLSSLPASYTYITAEVYKAMLDEVKVSNGQSMWNTLAWDTFDCRTIYRSHWRWPIS
jgi:class 3 adenylate cyclase